MLELRCLVIISLYYIKNMCILVEHKQVVHNYRQWNNENLLKTFSAYNNCKYKFCQRRKDFLVTFIGKSLRVGNEIFLRVHRFWYHYKIKEWIIFLNYPFFDTKVSLKLADWHIWFFYLSKCIKANPLKFMGHFFTVLPNCIIWAYFEATQCVKETKLH